MIVVRKAGNCPRYSCSTEASAAGAIAAFIGNRLLSSLSQVFVAYGSADHDASQQPLLHFILLVLIKKFHLEMEHESCKHTYALEIVNVIFFSYHVTYVAWTRWALPNQNIENLNIA